jgi:hypothetical protein
MQAQLAAFEEQRGTARRMQDFNRSLSEYASTPSAVGTTVNALANPGSGVTLSGLKDYMGANPVANQVTPEAIMGIAGKSGVLTPQMAAELATMGQGNNEFPVSELGIPRGSQVNGFTFVPTSKGGGQMLPTMPQVGSADMKSVPGYVPVPTGDGSRIQWLREPEEVSKARMQAANRLKSLRASEAKLAAKVASNDMSAGPDWLGLSDRTSKLAQVKSEIEGLERQFPDLATGGAAAAKPGRFGDYSEGETLVEKGTGRRVKIVNGQPVYVN